ncbi:Hypothetical predicted protein [Pelobates cultripes]|uniref:Uncharacterized protein n=1 Tax=Pelobates cultripes TaxID=61616 RepID=A0AAD1T5Y5_PELCU|nr:Hypothetical predicted protein [Pelobates cultripes]
MEFHPGAHAHGGSEVMISRMTTRALGKSCTRKRVVLCSEQLESKATGSGKEACSSTERVIDSGKIAYDDAWQPIMTGSLRLYLCCTDLEPCGGYLHQRPAGWLRGAMIWVTGVAPCRYLHPE